MPVTADIVPISSPLLAPLATAHGVIRERRSLLLVLRDAASGLAGIGEAAPLEPFTEDAAACEALLRAVCADPGLAAAAAGQADAAAGQADAAAGRADAAAIMVALDARAPELARSPAARCAVETALLDLEARRLGIPLQDHLAGSAAPRLIPVNAVIGSAPVADTAAAAAAAVAAGYTCLKCKVGVLPPAGDAERVRAVRAVAGPDVQLRLDANGAWDWRTALAFARSVEPCDIEYLEQPVPAGDLRNLERLGFRSPIAIAADEALRDIATARMLLEKDTADVYILKPMALGGPLCCRDFALKVIGSWRRCVITTLFDFAPGRRAAAALAASVPDCTLWHHGLATGALLARDLAADEVRAGTLLLDDAPGLGIAVDRAQELRP